MATEQAKLEARLMKEAEASVKESRNALLADFAQRWESALARADERQVKLEQTFKAHMAEREPGRLRRRSV